jgi:hypothetical protein
MGNHVINQNVDVLGTLAIPNAQNEAGNFLQLNALNIATIRTPSQVLSDLLIPQTYVPYTGAHSPVDLNTQPITTEGLGTFKGNLDLVDSDVNNVGSINFNTSFIPPPTWSEGKMYYDSTLKAWTLFSDIAGVKLPLGEQQRVRVYNPNLTESIPIGSALTSLTVLITS